MFCFQGDQEAKIESEDEEIKRSFSIYFSIRFKNKIESNQQELKLYGNE